MPESKQPCLVGLNHIALEVGDIEEALAFYGRLFTFKLRGKNESMAFIDMGDQFIALQKGRKQTADDDRHFGLVVDDREAARKALKATRPNDEMWEQQVRNLIYIGKRRATSSAKAMQNILATRFALLMLVDTVFAPKKILRYIQLSRSVIRG